MRRCKSSILAKIAVAGGVALGAHKFARYTQDIGISNIHTHWHQNFFIVVIHKRKEYQEEDFCDEILRLSNKRQIIRRRKHKERMKKKNKRQNWLTKFRLF